ncbi:sulfotransferase domain-containing protein [Azohydromonas lata]|uniref:Sulfotransferase domain-containing protein n=1 Tax=Azohydromonas lata TaxID=45677 RepID=A0ABU5I905_9BURK|nr:sulfotransferase domain-containing protein [Azohydromonas lata]MDZ5455584.1 sulfotransferase domain-containing protein [Azohydromonas lata]
MTTVPNFIIGGTEKAGTTSVFTYLLTHPEVCGSKVKETDFFRHNDCADPVRARETYGAHFAHCKPGTRVVMEASPGYLGESATVAPRMAAMLSDVKLLFILRHPVDRLYSSYNFHKSKLELPADLSFEDYVEKCLQFDRGATPESLGVGRWFLQVLDFGRYAQHLEPFLQRIPASRIQIMFYEDLQGDERGFMQKLCGFLNINPHYFDDYTFKAANVTFSSRFEGLHRHALKVNRMLEPVLRARPELKHSLVNLYKKFNQARQGYAPMSPVIRDKLQAYYAPSIRQLAGIVGEGAMPAGWMESAAAAGTGSFKMQPAR